MNKATTIILSCIAVLVSVNLLAQPTRPARPAKPAQAQKFKPPKVKTQWGRCVDSIRIPREELVQLVAIPLRITDAQNKAYTIVTYQIGYTRITVTEDEATGKVLPSSELVSERFTTTPLPPLWQENLKRRVQKGERLYFFDVIVKDAQGRLFFAPDLKVYIQ
jgi:hypothetical protein